MSEREEIRWKFQVMLENKEIEEKKSDKLNNEIKIPLIFMGFILALIAFVLVNYLS